MKKSKSSGESKVDSGVHSKPAGIQDASAATKQKPSKAFKKKLTNVSAVSEATPSVTAMAIDKLYLDLLISEPEMDAVLERALQLKKRSKLGRGTSKSTFFKHAFVQKLPSGAIARFHIVPNNRGKGANMQLVLNPNQMERGDSSPLIKMFKDLFPLSWKEIASTMLIRRIDVCLQLLGVSINDLLITLDGSKSGAKVYVTTDHNGFVQTIYMGDTQSPHHGAAYDQVASDEYKSTVGEKPSRQRLRDIAELVLEPVKKVKDRIQLESRRNFDKPVDLAQLAEITSPLGKYRILVLDSKAQKGDAGFCGYIDSVRLRGMHGARAHLSMQCGKASEVMNQVAEYEARLARMAAPWWNAEEYAASLLETLKKSSAWRFLKVMEKKK
ncbi:hypothetical protein CtesDRAFT_PD4226 [Comamonas testosteroni KF-1]|uniref:Uncharacterized protein n=2 Tax=Comamonas testosteroni TaxID=285 RepID=B7WU07_COMTK|nr:hypothetical protein CtesDRAFT_PD4226 [Comamonas testosteroni KF-1]